MRTVCVYCIQEYIFFCMQKKSKKLKKNLREIRLSNDSSKYDNFAAYLEIEKSERKKKHEMRSTDQEEKS